ncbi:MAG: TolC family protein [Blastocatellia bacterium]
MGHNTLIGIFAAFLILCVPFSALSDSSKPADQLKKTTSDLVSATDKYKASVEALIPFYENALKSANETVEKRKELYANGIISKRDLEAGEQAVKAAQSQLEQARRQITESDQLIVEAKAEAELAARKPKLPSSGTYAATSAILRNSGSAGWTIAKASSVQSYFASTFGRQLPISAYGQSATHNRMGFDHRNSVDVAVHPDSAEGKALIAYLHNNGIPFLAFRSAVAGAATGAHIHIGYPSHRI